MKGIPSNTRKMKCIFHEQFSPVTTSGSGGVGRGRAGIAATSQQPPPHPLSFPSHTQSAQLLFPVRRRFLGSTVRRGRRRAGRPGVQYLHIAPRRTAPHRTEPHRTGATRQARPCSVRLGSAWLRGGGGCFILCSPLPLHILTLSPLHLNLYCLGRGTGFLQSFPCLVAPATEFTSPASRKIQLSLQNIQARIYLRIPEHSRNPARHL